MLQVQERLEQLRTIDPIMLAEIVQQNQHCAAFEVTNWSFERLSNRGMVNPEGLFLFSGYGRSGAGQVCRPWSVVLKIIQKPAEEHTARDLWYWKRELLAAESGLLERLPGPVVAPHIYATTTHADSGWLWMEHIRANGDEPWALEQYAFAARALGRWHGVYLTGALLPDDPWLSAEQCRVWIMAGERIVPDGGWSDPYVEEAFAPPFRARVEQLRAERERFLTVLNRVPQVFSHFDFQRRNLFIRNGDGDQRQIVAIDWAWVGCGALGGDLVSLIWASALLCEVEPEGMPELEAVTFEAYLAGLRDTGWRGNRDLVRLGYTAWLAMWIGTGTQAWAAGWTADQSGETVMQQFGRRPEAFAAGLAMLGELALDRADEARRLIDRLQIG